MNKQQFLEMLTEILEADAGTIKGDEDLENLENWDSLAVITFIAAVDEKMNFVVSGEQLSKAKTVGDLMALVGIAA